MVTQTRNSDLYLLTVVGIIAAFGPFVTDFYLPALPALGGYFHTTASYVQLSLTFSMVGLAVGQLVIGPLSDRYGRKMTMLASLVLFCIATAGCLYAPDIHWFIFFRLLQGIAGAGGVVISKSIATDLYEGRELTRFYALLSSVQGLAPICAPVLGGLLLETTDWKGIFWILLAIGLSLIAALCFFKESLPRERRICSDVLSSFLYYMPVLRNKRFIGYVLVQAFAMGVMFAYIAASPFIFQEHYRLSPMAYSLCFGANALAIMLGSLTIPFFRTAEQALKAGAVGFGGVSLLAAGVLMGNAHVAIVEICLFIFLLFLGLILPSSTTQALDQERGNSGNASAVLGFLIFLFGGILSPLTGLGNILYTTGIIIVVCSLSAGACAWLVHERTPQRLQCFVRNRIIRSYLSDNVFHKSKKMS